MSAQKTLHTHSREPLLRMARRDSIDPGLAWAIRGAAFLLSLVTGAVIILLLGHNPLAVYQSSVVGAWRSTPVIRETYCQSWAWSWRMTKSWRRSMSRTCRSPAPSRARRASREMDWGFRGRWSRSDSTTVSGAPVCRRRSAAR